jgi:hypothetical protein
MTMKSNIIGAHAIIYSRKPEADRAFLRDTFGLAHVDVGEGWLIFGLPPAELAIHPSSKNNVHELYFMCRDIREFAAAMKDKKAACGPIQHMSWGWLTQLRLPGGGQLGVYQPLHRRPKGTRPPKKTSSRRRTTRRAA